MNFRFLCISSNWRSNGVEIQLVTTSVVLFCFLFFFTVCVILVRFLFVDLFDALDEKQNGNGDGLSDCRYECPGHPFVILFVVVSWSYLRDQNVIY